MTEYDENYAREALDKKISKRETFPIDFTTKNEKLRKLAFDVSTIEVNTEKNAIDELKQSMIKLIEMLIGER